MGYNTTVVVMNDALGSIDDDTRFGEKLVEAIRGGGIDAHKVIDVTAGSFIGAARVIETHHSSDHVPVVVGGNAAVAFELTTLWMPDVDDMERELLFRLAQKHGYTLRRKSR